MKKREKRGLTLRNEADKDADDAVQTPTMPIIPTARSAVHVPVSRLIGEPSLQNTERIWSIK